MYLYQKTLAKAGSYVDSSKVTASPADEVGLAIVLYY